MDPYINISNFIIYSSGGFYHSSNDIKSVEHVEYILCEKNILCVKFKKKYTMCVCTSRS